MATLNDFDIVQLARMDDVFTDKEGSTSSGAGWKPKANGKSIGIVNYRTNDANTGNKQGIDLRGFKEVYAVGVTTRKIVPVATTGSAFGQGVRLEGCGDSYLRDVHIDNERWLADNVNADGFNENGNSNDGFEDTTLYGIDWTILNPGETGFDCKKHNFKLHRGVIAGALENCAKFWRRKDGTFSEFTFDLRGAASSGKFFRLPSGDAIIKIWNCQFIDQAGNITSMPPENLVTLDSGSVYSQIVDLNVPPAYLSDPYFLGGQDPVPAPDPDPELLAQIAVLEIQIVSLMAELEEADLFSTALMEDNLSLEAQIVILEAQVASLTQKIATAIAVLSV